MKVSERPLGVIAKPKQTVVSRIIRYNDGENASDDDQLAIEEPLEIAIVHGGRKQVLSVTLRSPGDERDLVYGFLFSEGIIDSEKDVVRIEVQTTEGKTLQAQRVTVVLARSVSDDRIQQANRQFPLSAACGACGKSALEALRVYRQAPLTVTGPVVEPRFLLQLPQLVEEAQHGFASTGGVHAAARVYPESKSVEVAEDIGRHNALDKLIGRGIRQQQSDWSGSLVMLSGRVGFDLMQKCVVAGIPFVVSVGAPSSLAVEMACFFNITLVGFLRGERFNVYSAQQRLAGR